MQALILCGGLSTRLGEITKEIPKVLLKIGHKTVLQHQVELLAEAGAKEIFLASGHLHDVLEAEVGDSLAGIPIRYVREHKRLGTGGAIKNAFAQMSDFPSFVLNGDILLDTSLRGMTEQLTPDMQGIILGVEVPDARSYGLLDLDGENHHIKQFIEKDPNYEGKGFINGGIYLFNESIQSLFPDTDVFSIEYDVFQKADKLHAYPYSGAWIDIGTPERLAFAREHLVETVEKER